MKRRFSIVGLGEVLWDLLPAGRQLGGAPANFTVHAQALGAEAWLVSRVGNDELGRSALKQLADVGVRTECVTTDDEHPTGTVSVELEAGQPRYVIHENVAWDFVEATSCAFGVVSSADAVCFGTLAQRSETSRATIRELLAAAPYALRVCDVNLRQRFYSSELLMESLAASNVLKLNDAELPVLADLFSLRGTVREQITALMEKFPLRLLVLTRGAHGSILVSGGEWSEHPGTAVDVKDTIGAGDSFTAATVLGHLSGWPLNRINTFANEVAAFVCSQHGAMPPLPREFSQHFVPTQSE